jgi:hypothetical protein
MVDNEQKHGTNNSDEQAIQIQSGYSACTERAEQPSANYGTDNPEENIQDQPLAPFVYQLASDESGK